MKEVNYDANVRANVENAIKEIASQNLQPKPIINLKLVGKLPPGTQQPKLLDLADKYSQQTIVNFNSKLESEEFAQQVDLLRAIRESRLSPEEQGLKILQKNLNQGDSTIKVDEIFDLLTEGEVENIFNVLTGKQTTLM